MKPASIEALQIGEVTTVLLIGGALLFLLTMGLLALALRRRKAAVSPAVWIFGLGLALPAVVLGALMAYAAVRGKALAAPPPADALLVGITGRLWWWELRYETPQGPVVTANELRLPLGRAANIALASEDVVHSFWAPALGGKMDLVPGRLNRLTITPTRAGTFLGPCAEFCGQQHARMALRVIVMKAPAFEQWLAQQAAPAMAAQGAHAERGRQLFTQHGCVACHAVRESSGLGSRLGPDLTHLASRTHLGAGTLPNDAASLRHWISDIQAIKPGTRMPSFNHLPVGDLDALTAYLGGLK